MVEQTLSSQIIDTDTDLVFYGTVVRTDPVRDFIKNLIRDFGEVKVGKGSDRQELGEIIKERAGAGLL